MKVARRRAADLRESGPGEDYALFDRWTVQVQKEHVVSEEIVNNKATGPPQRVEWEHGLLAGV